MSQAVPPPQAAEAKEYVQQWAASISQVLAQIAGAPFAVECDDRPPADASSPHPTDLEIIAAATGNARGELAFRLPKAIAMSLAGIFLGEPQTAESELTGDRREAMEELFRQFAGQAATALKARWGETQIRLEFGTEPSWPAAAEGWIISKFGAPSHVEVEWRMSAALLAALRAQPQPVAVTEPPIEFTAAPESSGAAVSAAPNPKIDPFMMVELDVALRFGGRRMLLREILELTSGSVIELDRQVQEPADLLLDGRPIARGEVVVVDGNYGLRIVEVLPSPSAAERTHPRP